MSPKRSCLTWSSKLVPYRTAWEMQLQQIEKIATGKAMATVFFLEHPQVITSGKAGNDEHVLLSEFSLRKKGIEYIKTNRGGDVTFHGPGQLVVYLMLPLAEENRDLHAFMRKIENVGLNVLSDFGLCGSRYKGYSGVWVGDEKIMAIGFGVKKWVTFHGLAFNYGKNLEGFKYIIPCGIEDKDVTSLYYLLQKNVTREEVEERFSFHLSNEFKLDLMPMIDPINNFTSQKLN